MYTVEKIKDGYIVHDNNNHHSHNSKGVCKSIKWLLDSQSKPNDQYIKYLKKKGINTTIERLEESILRFIPKRKYDKWKEWRFKQKYYNRQGRKIV